jgi:hypothetical protein
VLWEDKIRNWAGYDYILVRNPQSEAAQLDGDSEMVSYRLLEGVSGVAFVSLVLPGNVRIASEAQKRWKHRN